MPVQARRRPLRARLGRRWQEGGGAVCHELARGSSFSTRRSCERACPCRATPAPRPSSAVDGRLGHVLELIGHDVADVGQLWRGQQDRRRPRPDGGWPPGPPGPPGRVEHDDPVPSRAAAMASMRPAVHHRGFRCGSASPLAASVRITAWIARGCVGAAATAPSARQASSRSASAGS